MLITLLLLAVLAGWLLIASGERRFGKGFLDKKEADPLPPNLRPETWWKGHSSPPMPPGQRPGERRPPTSLD